MGFDEQRHTILLGPIGSCPCEPTICFQRVFNFRGTRWNIDKCVTVACWSRLVNVYPETSFKSLPRAISVLHIQSIHSHRTNCPCDVTNPREVTRRYRNQGR